jgi:hypothetical protein
VGILEVERYTRLIQRFLDGDIGATEFEAAFLQAYKADPTEWPDSLFNALDSLFADVDAFCADPTLRGPDSLDEQQLRASCTAALAKLQSLATQ